MKPWNPYAMTFNGEPITGQVPPKVVVYGPPMTVQQGAFLQYVFALFQSQARLSVVQNPTTRGRFADGTPYTIECSGGSCTCTVWTTEQLSDDDRRSGIAIQFGDLSGNPLDAHGTTTYLLTPNVKKKTRIPTGKWKVRKIKEPMGGGKAVNADTDGTLYFTGVSGRDEEDYPLSHRVFSVNERAIMMEDTEAELSMFRHGEAKCLSADANSPIPFVLTWEEKKYAAQLVFRELTPGLWEVDLRVGPMKQEPDEVVGAVVGTVSFPSGRTPRADKTSFRPDGQVARTQVTRWDVIEWGDFQITPTSIAYQSVGSKNMGSGSTYNYDAPINIVEQEFFPVGGHRSYTEYNFNTYQIIGGEQVSRPAYTSTGTGEQKYRYFDGSGIVYAFGPRGQEIYTENAKNTDASSSFHNEKYTVVKSWSNADPSIPSVEDSTLIQEYRFESHVYSGSSELTEFMGGDTESTLRTRIHTSGTFIKKATTPRYGANYYEYSGPGGTSTKETYMPGSMYAVFFDRYQEFAIVVDYVGEKTTSVMKTTSWITTGSMVYHSYSYATTQRNVTLIVKGRNGIVMRKALDPDVGHYFVAYSASDPMTGALVVNLQKVTGMSRKSLESWIYVIDDTGVKTIQDLFKGLPENTCARRNHLLYSL